MFAFAGLLTGLAFLKPMTPVGALLGWAAALTLCAVVGFAYRFYFNFFIYGFVVHITGFYWLPYTIENFGGFSSTAATFLFVLYCAVSSLQFVICAWLYSRFKNSLLNRLQLALPLAWVIAEAVVPRLFPWALSHTQISWKSFALIGSAVDVELLSGLLLWWANIFVFMFRSSPGKVRVLFAFVCSLSALYYGAHRVKGLRDQLLFAPSIGVALVQGNIAMHDKGDVRYLDVNVDRYRQLTTQVMALNPDLVVWPESVLNYWTPADAVSVKGTRFDPIPARTTPLLYGALSFRERTATEVEAKRQRALVGALPADDESMRYARYNSGVAIDKDGKVLGRYHKRVLMPFGEFLPFAEYFPVLRKISPHTGDLDAGELDQPIVFPNIKDRNSKTGKNSVNLSIAPLICYEDLVPSLSREGVQNGANLLINLTNDAWYGDTLAPYQHHLLAAWRAIETERYLIRSTNTGLTAIVNPMGDTISQLPTFTSQVLFEFVSPLDTVTPYVRAGHIPLWCVIGLSLLIWLFGGTYHQEEENYADFGEKRFGEPKFKSLSR